MAGLPAAGKDRGWLQHDLVTAVIRAGEFTLPRIQSGWRNICFSGCAEVFSQCLLGTELMCRFLHDRGRLASRVAAVKLCRVSVSTTHLKLALQTNQGLIFLSELGTPRHPSNLGGPFSQGL